MDRTILAALLPAFLLGGCVSRGPPRPPADLPAVPEVRVPRTAKPPAIDGVLDEAVWADAATLELVGDSGDALGQAPLRPTEVRLAWDDSNLYVALRCADRDIHSRFTGRDARLWDAGYDEIEVAEFMLSPTDDLKRYFEFNFSPRGVVLDLAMQWRWGKLYTDVDWNANVRSAVAVYGTLNDSSDEDRGWTVELALPWQDLDVEAPTPGETSMRANFFRCDNSEEVHFAVWSPTGRGSFHIPSRFGILSFDGDAAP